MRKLLVSTGTMVGRLNGYNYKRALTEIRELYECGLCSGLELMMLRHYYDIEDDVVKCVAGCGVEPLTIHCEKEIGTMISDAGELDGCGKTDDAEELFGNALRLFRLNCSFAERLHIGRMVLHLWGGNASDGNIGYNTSKLYTLNKTAERFGVRILIENIPSRCTDPLTNWRGILPHLGNAGLIFDTRFGKLHEQTRDILSDKTITDKIEHVHISDFGGGYREFSALRPILHPGEGKIDFTEVSALLDKMGYDGTITLESPVMEDEQLNTDKLENTLRYLKKEFHTGESCRTLI